MKTAVMTVAVGGDWGDILLTSGPTIERYAKKMGSDFIVIRDGKFPTRLHAYEKLRVRELLDSYDRVVVIDADCIVRKDTPSLLDLVPVGSFGAVIKPPNPESERMWIRGIYESHARSLHLPVPNHGDLYFSTGVFVCDRGHRGVFSDPPVYAFAFYEQTYINIRVIEHGVPFFKIPCAFNCWNVVSRGKEAYVLHYTRSCTKLPTAEYRSLLQKQIDLWEAQ